MRTTGRIALTGEQIGNFPQAFTHLALIDAAITLDRELDLRTRRPRTREPSVPTQRAAPATEEPSPPRNHLSSTPLG